jgi:Protein of unknown function (DUF2846)
MSAGLFLAVGSAAAQHSTKVYVEGSDAATALRILHDRCPVCSAVIKKDAADFVILLSSTEGKTDLSLFEAATGGLVKQTTAESLDSAVASALEAIRSYVPAAKAAAPPLETGNATAYVYRYKQFVGGALEPSVFCDETEVARMDNGRYFTVDLKPGKHIFRSNDTSSPVSNSMRLLELRITCESRSRVGS